MHTRFPGLRAVEKVQTPVQSRAGGGRDPGCAQCLQTLSWRCWKCLGTSISPGLTEMPQIIGRRFHALVRRMGESHSALSFYQCYLLNKSQIHFSFIHGHFNPSQLLPLTPRLSPCLFSPSYFSFPSDFFFDYELFRSALTFPNTWKIWGFFPPILFSHFIALY